jgi:hypothetical protein
MTCGPGERHLLAGCCGQLLEHDVNELNVASRVSFPRTGRFVSRCVVSHRLRGVVTVVTVVLVARAGDPEESGHG